MESWQNFFLGELGASAALAGLIFVSLSVNQARILELASLPERGLQALLALFLVLLVSSVMLVPAQGPPAVGMEIIALAAIHIVSLFLIQRTEIRCIAIEYRHNAVRMAVLSQLAAWPFAAAGGLLVARDDWAGLYVLVPATLLSFAVAGFNAWVLLIEINR